MTLGYLQQQLPIRNTCPFCESCAESIDHLAFFCPTTLQIFGYVGLPPIPAFQSNDFGETFAKWFTQQNKSQQLLLSVSYWAIWVIARDSQGLIMAACTYPHTGIANSFASEAIACKRATMFAIDLGFRSVQIEGYSLSIIKKINSPTMDKSIVSPIIRDILLLKGLFEAITFSFVGMNGNKVAHALAKLGLQNAKPRYWIEEAPVSIEQVVLQECPLDFFRFQIVVCGDESDLASNTYPAIFSVSVKRSHSHI
ncbi:hypothetical protein V6N12_055226 [Hibiscus sabdariffa]|uniref:RNase H type-1 domain-containing protein n=1 Tax=Hibiscus sabdariffa TaxID=183260 RepID=A0ABR2BP79_9ROSI